MPIPFPFSFPLVSCFEPNADGTLLLPWSLGRRSGEHGDRLQLI